MTTHELPLPNDFKENLGNGHDQERGVVEVKLQAPKAILTEGKTLGEVADLDKLLGFKGNYMVFPAAQPNYMHAFMMQDYVASDGSLKDPDWLESMSVDEAVDYLKCVRSRHESIVYEAARREVSRMLARRISEGRLDSNSVVLPSDALYIEALPGSRPIMESFKRVHRATDVKKAQAEVRGLELENLRLAARLVAGREGGSGD